MAEVKTLARGGQEVGGRSHLRISLTWSFPCESHEPRKLLELQSDLGLCCSHGRTALYLAASRLGQAGGVARLDSAHFSPTVESCGVSAQIGSGVVRGGAEVRFHQVPPGFHQSSTRVLPGFRQGSTSVPRSSTRAVRGGERRMLLAISPELNLYFVTVSGRQTLGIGSL